MVSSNDKRQLAESAEGMDDMQRAKKGERRSTLVGDCLPANRKNPRILYGWSECMLRVTRSAMVGRTWRGGGNGQ